MDESSTGRPMCPRAASTLGSAAFAALCTWLMAQPLAAQQAPASGTDRSVDVTITTSDIVIDGALDESAWAEAPTIGELIQREPTLGAAPTERSEVKLLHDADYLYIGVVCFDSEMDRIVSTDMSRDAGLMNQDRIEILLDTYGDRRNAFYFATNPAGALVDGLVFNGQSNQNWDAIWTVRTQHTSEGWTAEFAIPFKSLTFPSDRSQWGFNFQRYVVRKQEETRWAGVRLQTEFLQVSEAGRINQLEGLSQGMGVNVRPFVAGRWLHTQANGGDTSGKPGLDMFYNITPSLKLTSTLNTDFGETEADARQINLTRFSLLFPEKRAFFLEDTGVFTFSNTATSAPFYLSPTHAEVIPFFSRQVGLLRGTEVPIEGGVKLTGKVGRTDLGLLGVRTGDVNDVVVAPARNFFVGRVKQNLLAQSYVGAILAHGNPDSDATGTTWGADVRLATSNFLGRRRNLILNAYGVQSLNEGVSGDDLSYGASLEYPNDLWDAEILWRDVQRNFDPAMGFIATSNIRVFRTGFRYSPRPKDFLGLQQMYNGVYYNRYWRLDTGEVQAWNLFFTIPMDWHFKSGDALHALLSPDINYNRLFLPFEIAPGIKIAPGEYRFTRWSNNFATAARRKIQANLRWTFGTYWTGHAHEIGTTFTYRLPPRLSIMQSTNQTFARLPEGNFVTRIVSLQGQVAMSPFLTVSNLAQYDNRSRNLSWQGRMRWTLQPGSDVFLVFNRGWIQDMTQPNKPFMSGDSKVSTKVQYTLTF